MLERQLGITRMVSLVHHDLAVFSDFSSAAHTVITELQDTVCSMNINA